ncbi:MAG: ArgE/DapE family deacylase [Planctomycetota bacterium]|nr:ArgE/DapE family deacylase [Planctomycetota bacterium]
MTTMDVDREFILSTLRDLVRINSVNPSLMDGAPGESEISDYTAALMGDLGLETQTIVGTPGRPSTLGWKRGLGGGKSLMLNAHYDTVGVVGMADPFSGKVENGQLLGRGSYDMKGALAACLGAIKILNDEGVELQGDVVVAAVADEEHGSLGTSDVIKSCTVDGAIVTEPTQLGICLAHKGFVWVEIVTKGRAYHGSQYQEGVDANMHMGRVLQQLEPMQRHFEQLSGHPLVGPPSLHASLIQGGTAESVYSARCTMTIERRTIPGETEAQVLEVLKGMLDKLHEEDASFSATMRSTMNRPPFEVDREASIVKAVAGAVQATMNMEPKYTGENPWMDSALLSGAGVETVVIGPSGGGAHSDHEWVDLDSVYELSRILAHAVMTYCGT